MLDASTAPAAADYDSTPDGLSLQITWEEFTLLQQELHAFKDSLKGKVILSEPELLQLIDKRCRELLEPTSQVVQVLQQQHRDINLQLACVAPPGPVSQVPDASPVYQACFQLQQQFLGFCHEHSAEMLLLQARCAQLELHIKSSLELFHQDREEPTVSSLFLVVDQRVQEMSRDLDDLRPRVARLEDQRAMEISVPGTMLKEFETLHVWSHGQIRGVSTEVDRLQQLLSTTVARLNSMEVAVRSSLVTPQLLEELATIGGRIMEVERCLNLHAEKLRTIEPSVLTSLVQRMDTLQQFAVNDLPPQLACLRSLRKQVASLQASSSASTPFPSSSGVPTGTSASPVKAMHASDRNIALSRVAGCSPLPQPPLSKPGKAKRGGRPLSHSSSSSSDVPRDPRSRHSAPRAEASSSSSSASRHVRKTKESSGGRPDSQATRELISNVIGKPRWDGKSTSWESFWKEWRVYWSLNKRLVAPEGKKFLFVQCLPSLWRDHMKAYITDRDWTFEQMRDFLFQQAKVLAPPWKRRQDWKSCMPSGKTYLDFTHWWLSWEHLGRLAQVDNHEDWISQFDVALNWKGNFQRFLKLIVECEILESRRWTLEERATFVSNKLLVEHQTGETLRDTPGSFQRPEGGSSKGRCFKCGETGHRAVDCRSSRRTEGPRPSSRPSSSGHHSRERERGHIERRSSASSYRPPSSSSRVDAARVSSTERQRRVDHNLCSYCGQSGHWFRECPVAAGREPRRSSAQRHVSSSADRARSHSPSTPRGKSGSKGAKGKGRGPGERRPSPAAKPFPPRDGVRPPSSSSDRKSPATSPSRFYPSNRPSVRAVAAEVGVPVSH